MAEQYIYSRAEKEFTNALNQTVAGGFGFMAFSPGMNAALKEAVRSHCQDCPQLSQTDSQGNPLPLLRKARLPKGQVLLQRSTWAGGAIRDFHVAHGYVLEEELKNFGPEKWFHALFRLEDPNKERGGIILESRLELLEGEAFHAKPLKETMDSQGISRESFRQLLLACFDVLALGRQMVLVAWDFDRPGEQELRRSVLYWIYTCLPYDLWSGLGFDSVYSEMSAPGQIHLAFVDKASVQGSDKNINIQVGKQSNPLGGNFLVLNGAVIHNDGKYPTEWYGKNGVYARWLGQIVNTLWECTSEDLPSVTQALAEFHLNFQKLLAARDKRLNPKWYDAVFIRSLSSTPEALTEICNRVQSSVSESEYYNFGLAFLDSLTEQQQRNILMILLQNHKRKKTPVDGEEIQSLCSLFDRGLKAPVSGLLGAFMAEEADARGEVAPVMARYQEMLPPEIYSTLPERVFFSKANGEDARFWTECGVDASEKAAKRRRDTWFREKVPNTGNLWELPVSAGRAFEGLKGVLKDQQMAEFWQEPFRARCREISESKKELSSFVNDKNLPQRFDDLQSSLSRLPGGITGVRDEVEKLQQKAYDQLLREPEPFMNGQWLRNAVILRKIGGETGEMLDILSSFVSKSQCDLKSWVSCCKGKSENVQRMVLEEKLPKMFLQGTLLRLDSKFVELFLILYPKYSQQILFQAASQGGSRLLLDVLKHLKKYPIKYPGKLGHENPTAFSRVLEIVRGDSQIRDKLREKEGDGTLFYEQVEEFFREPETGKTPPSSAAAGSTGEKNVALERPDGRRNKKDKRRR